MLQKAFLRAAALPNVQEVMTVTNRELFFKTEDEYREVNIAKLATSFILEPFGRNTAPAIASSALRIATTHGGETTMLVLAADQLISDQEAFVTAATEAAVLASKGRLVTFGIRPDSPQSGYGYIQADNNRVIRFIEKPSLEKAEQYVAAGFLWNSGMFCFRAKDILEAMEQHCPEILAPTKACVLQSRIGVVELTLDAETFRKVPDDSLDYSVMEKSDKVAVVPCDIGWSDVGSWSSLGDLHAPDENGNRVDGEALLHDVSNCYVKSGSRVVAAVGTNDLIIVDTPDALLVADRKRAQDVKHIYAALKARGDDSYKHHVTVHRPWGTYTVLQEDPRFKIKRIEVRPGQRLSLQMHHHRSEHWVVVSGMARIVNGEKEMFIGPKESTYIPAGHKHRLENPGLMTLVMIEVQSGEYLGEDDIVRFEDNYGRV